jgi:PAS domain S-box-containing protein
MSAVHASLPQRRDGAAPQSASGLHGLLDLAADWIWETDHQHRLTLVRCSSRYPGEHLPPLGRASWDGLAPHQQDARAHLLVAMESQQPFRSLETVRYDAAGRPRHLRLSGQPVFDGGGRFLGYRGIGVEVTSHKEAEQALNASESQLAAVIDASVDAILTCDADGRVLLFSQAAAAMFGCGRMQALGQPLARWLPQALEFIRAAHARAAGRPAELVRRLALRARREDGAEFPAEASVSRIVCAGQSLYCLTVRDLGPSLAAEQSRQSLELQLRQSQKMEALGTLAGGIAHDFNNIVAAILGNARLARERCEPGAPALPFVAEIARAGVRARDLVQRILSFSRNQPTVFECQALQALVQEGVQLLRAMLPSGIEVAYDGPARPLLVRADPTQISQLLMNLGTNAWQAIGRGPGRIAIALVREGDQACLSVCDNGCGMDRATQERIFEPFFTTKAKGEGTGLGLPVVHGIVRAHGGQIEVRSEPGRGSTFRVRLPIAPDCEECATPSSAQAGPLQEPGRGRGQHVLYLDDYPAMVLMVKAVLEGQGYRVSGFEDPLAALRWLDQCGEDVALVVSDYNMPGCSGLELAAELRRLRPGLPLVLASGFVDDELRERAARLGVRHLFDKPRGVEELCTLVGEVLRS